MSNKLRQVITVPQEKVDAFKPDVAQFLAGLPPQSQHLAGYIPKVGTVFIYLHNGECQLRVVNHDGHVLKGNEEVRQLWLTTLLRFVPNKQEWGPGTNEVVVGGGNTVTIKTWDRMRTKAHIYDEPLFELETAQVAETPGAEVISIAEPATAEELLEQILDVQKRTLKVLGQLLVAVKGGKEGWEGPGPKYRVLTAEEAATAKRKGA